MEIFIILITSYPVVIYTFLLCLVVFYWLVACLGMVDIDILDFASSDIDADFEVGTQGEAGAEGLAGLLMKLGLNGVPVTVILSLLILLSWLISYFAAYFFFHLLPLGLVRYLIGTGVLIGAWMLALPTTALLIKPLKPLFKKLEGATPQSILGQAAVVRTSRVDDRFGEASFNDGGAGLILKIRSNTPNTLKSGDRVVLLEYLEDQHAYRVIPERDFY